LRLFSRTCTNASELLIPHHLIVEASHVRQAATPSLKQHRYLAEEFILAAPVISYTLLSRWIKEMASFVTHKYNSKGEKSSADVIKGGRRIQRWPYRSEGQSRSTKKQPVIRNNQDSHFNAIHLCPSSGRQAN
ncbi:hypothetical protein T06_14899, partial [Trichinella sp. T6]